MNPALSLLVWFVVLLIVFFIFWWLAGYSGWQSFVVAVLLALIGLLVVFPWNFERHHQDSECKPWGHDVFFVIVLTSITILLAYIITTYIWYPDCVLPINTVTHVGPSTVLVV